MIVDATRVEEAMARVTLHTIFPDAYPAYEQTHPLPPHVRRAARAIMQCRTAALGGHIQACPDGHVSRIWYNACRHRSCPQCAFLQTERWLALQQARLLACDHDHVIFTLPHDLKPRWLCHVPVMRALLFQAARDTLVAFLGDPQYLGAQPGIIAALHTWSQTLVLHPHLPCLVTGGGLSALGQWGAVRHGFLFPMRVVMAVFRGKRLEAIRRACARGALQWPEARRPHQLSHLLKRLGHPRKTRWQVRIMERSAHGHGGVTSLARDLRGGPIKNARLVAWDGQRVTLTSQDRHAASGGKAPAPQRMPLRIADFLQRWRRHVPAPQTRVVRGYGRYHHPHMAALAQCRAALGQPPVAAPVRLDWQRACAQWGDSHPERGAICGQLLVCTDVIPRGGAPPSALAQEHAA